MYRFHELYRYMMGMISGIAYSVSLSDQETVQRIQYLFDEFARVKSESLREEEEIRNTVEKGKW